MYSNKMYSKVMVMKMSESSILHTWYGNQNQNIVAAVRNQVEMPRMV